VRLALPLSPGRAEFLTLPGAAWLGYALWRDGLVLTAVLVAHEQDEGESAPLLAADASDGLRIVFADAPVGTRNGAIVRLETTIAPAAARSEAQDALVRHLADAADRAQTFGGAAPLHDLADRSARALMADAAVDKRGLDRLLLRVAADRHGCGADADAALVAHALLQRFHQTGTEAEKRRAFLLARGVCEFQIVEENAPHRGAFWDALRAKKHFEDASGNATLGVATTARATLGLHHLHAAFGQDVMSRTALAGAQWLLLKQDTLAGRFAGSRYHADGPPVENGSAWPLVYALRPLIETFRRTGNEIFLKAALRSVQRGLIEGLADGGFLSLADDVSTASLAEAVEGVLCLSRESQNADMIALAKRLGGVLRARRAANGMIVENNAPDLPATLAACHAALALARVDDDPIWPLFALRGLRAVAAMTAGEDASRLRPADHGALLTLPTHLLLTLAARAPGGGVADRDALTLTRAGWQTFAPDPTTREFLRVESAQENGEAVPIDHLALVCPFNLQVLVAVCAPPGLNAVRIVKNGRAPYVKNLLTGDYGTDAALVPLGDGRDTNIGVFLADT